MEKRSRKSAVAKRNESRYKEVMEVPGPIPPGGAISPLAPHKVSQEREVDPKTVGVATLLLQQALSQAVSNAKHTAQLLDSSTAAISGDISPAANLPVAPSLTIGTQAIWAP
jgi:hypothetical protein